MAKEERLSFTREDAARVVLVKTLECDCPPKDWSNAQGDQASIDARHLLGDKANKATWLVQRAKLILTRTQTKEQPAIDIALNHDWFGKSLGLLTFVLVILGYLLGAFSDRLSSTGSMINLLAPPILGLILWNILIYVALIVQAVLGFRFELPLQKGLYKAITFLASAKLPGRALIRTFFAAWLPHRIPGLKHRLRRACHLAALAFAVGILSSIAIRGIGTAYHVGWESTWFAGRADIVEQMIHAIYGLIPWTLPNTAPLPDTAGVAALEWTAGMAPLAGSNAAPWLWRLIQTIFWIVLLPRLLLVLWETLSLKVREKRVTLNCTEPYYRAVLGAANQKTVAHLMVDASLMKLPRWAERDGLPQGLSPDITSMTYWDTDNEELAELWEKTVRPIPVFNALHTPEEDVQGIWIKRLTEKLPAGFPVCVDFSLYDERFDGNATPQRGGRIALWEQFIEAHGARAIIVSAKTSADELGAALNATKPLS